MKAIVLAASLGLLFGTVPAMAGTQSGNGTNSPAAKSHMKSAQADVNAQKHPKSASPSLKSPPAVPMPTGGSKVAPQDRPGGIVPAMESR
jgi:hypothetical protein